ncbi:14987_t:CDS:2 [Racocetra fulgida]|uniref:14987_t:CDS:1 n=1 Tax=Racocetra fulgida TaxID=60492 RepID=A0A9N9AX25_9GLOM|nr:14987_t:CDS:2 [Racocetra fulgida]
MSILSDQPNLEAGSNLSKVSKRSGRQNSEKKTAGRGIKKTLYEDNNISILSDQPNSEIGGTLSEVNKSYSQQNSEISIQAVNSKPNSDVSNQQQIHRTTDPISYSQTYDIDIESSSNLLEEQFTGLTNTFLTTTNHPSTSYATMFKIAAFVADHPDILSTANMIHQSKQRSWNQHMPKELLTREPLTPLSNQDNEKQSISESTLENPSQTAFDQLVAMILPSSKLADDDFQQLLEKSKAMFSEFQYTLNKDLKNLANEYLKNSSNLNALDERRFKRYINYDVTKKVLSKYLANARESEFMEITRDTLKRFIRAAFKVYVIHAYKEIQQEFSSYQKVLEDIKNMNAVT